MLDDCSAQNNNSEKDLTRKERATLAQLRFGYCGLLGFYKSQINLSGSAPHNSGGCPVKSIPVVNNSRTPPKMQGGVVG